MIINEKSLNWINKFDKCFNNFSLEEKFNWFYEIYNKYFLNKYNSLKEIKNAEKIEKEKLNELNQYIKLNERFLRFLNTLEDIIKTKLSITKYFTKIENRKLLKRATFFREYKLFSKFLSKKTINFKNLFHKSKKPKKIHHVYNDIQRKAIVDYIDYVLENTKINGKFWNKTTIWLSIRNDGVLRKYGDFSNISLNTINKIYKQEKGITLINNSHINKKHPKRNKPRKVGSFQMDLKVLGLKETNVGEYIYVFDMIDECGRNVFSEVLNEATTNNVTVALRKAISFFKNIGINIKTIQTDNAMMFKKTNYINDNKFHKVLSEELIKHIKIPLGEPECNGVVERYHLKIDKEARSHLLKCKTKEEVAKVIKDYMHFHNNERYHYYYEFAHGEIKLPYSQRFMKPIDAIKIIPCYY